MSASLDGRSTAVAVVAAVVAWTIWGLVLVASFVDHPVTLTAVRVATPVGPVAAVAVTTVWAAPDAAASTTALGIAGVVLSLVATACAWSGPLSDEYVDGASYGDERRFALRVPATFLLGPVPVFWLALVGGATAGPLLLAARAWIPGVAVTLLGAVVAVPAVRAFHGLSKRWLVFVPAGITLVDHLVLVDPVLFPARRIAGVGPAPVTTTATDLSQGAWGLVLEIAFDAPVEVAARTSRSDGELQLLDAVLVSPAGPGAVVVEATRRGLQRAVVSGTISG